MSIYDEVMYNGHHCLVEQVWEAGDREHTPFCAIRPLDYDGEYSGAYAGTFFVEQSAVRPVCR